MPVLLYSKLSLERGLDFYLCTPNYFQIMMIEKENAYGSTEEELLRVRQVNFKIDTVNKIILAATKCSPQHFMLPWEFLLVDDVIGARLF